MKLRTTMMVLATMACPVAAWAHPGTISDGGFVAGLAHPFSGWDHMIAMVAVGMWAAQLGGRARWMVPLAFVCAMVLGGALALSGILIPGVEIAIGLSVLVLGAVVLLKLRASTWLAMVVVALFAVFHGHAHGTELPAAASAFGYSVGFVTATALLHLAGIGAGLPRPFRGRATATLPRT